MPGNPCDRAHADLYNQAGIELCSIYDRWAGLEVVRLPGLEDVCCILSPPWVSVAVAVLLKRELDWKMKTPSLQQMHQHRH